MDGCYELTGHAAESLTANRDISYNEIISPEYRDVVRSEREKALLQHSHYHHEYEIITKSGQRKWVLARGRGIYDARGNVEALEGIVLDISGRKKREHQIVHLQEHDFLTGLYNRNRMDREKSRLDRPEFWPLSVAICDIDGLRMINDAYSHEEGDQLIIKTAKLIQGCLGSDCVLGHVGGGEFVLLLPHTDGQAAHRLKTDIKNAIERYNRANANVLYTISVSMGHSTKTTEEQKMLDVTRDAEEHLNRSKLLNQNSTHSAIVSAIMSTLYAKSQETEQHGQRLGKLCRIMGERLGLEQKSLDDLQLLSKLHDIGKIGIGDHILNKPGKLSEDEWKIMRQHPEIGHRIAVSTPQLEHIADYILYHHERWDGTGYPKGLKGRDIPIVSRILAIADAFDAMTEDRIYRKALPREAAIEEIRRNAGTQFDPEVARLFLACHDAAL
jgi:diguanylate cyclase (GGDEF)-like protein/PAS domain S-box-containing protein